MASNILTAVLAATLLVHLSTSVHGQCNREQKCNGGDMESSEQCVVSAGEIECAHIMLELILKSAVSNYCERYPHKKRQAPWFDPFKHVSYNKNGRCMDTALHLLGNVDIRESLSFCVRTYGNGTEPYVPSSPGQMYKDMCAENARIRSEIQ